MLGYLITAWFAAGILLSIHVITLQGFRKSMARDPQHMRTIYALPADTCSEKVAGITTPNRAPN